MKTDLELINEALIAVNDKKNTNLKRDQEAHLKFLKKHLDDIPNITYKIQENGRQVALLDGITFYTDSEWWCGFPAVHAVHLKISKILWFKRVCEVTTHNIGYDVSEVLQKHKEALEFVTKPLFFKPWV